MRDVKIQIEGLTPYSAAQHFDDSLMKGETKDAHEKRRWREKAHADPDGNVYIPGVSFKLALDEAVSQANEKITGKGNQTYSGLFKSGVAAISDVFIGMKLDDLKSISIYAHANGKRGPGTRVTRWFPFVPTWGGDLELRIFNDSIPEHVFERFFEQAGLVAGVGRGRPITGCPAGNGRFKAKSFVWS